MSFPESGARPEVARTRRPDIEGRTVRVAGRETFVREAGSGPAVVLLHGSGPGTTGAAWEPLMAAMAPDFRVIAPDFVGFGRSRMLPGPGSEGEHSYGRRAWTAQVLELLDELALDRCAVVGNSMGGAIALSVAHARPRSVTRLVGIGTLGLDMPLPPGLDQLWAYRPGRAAARGLLELLHVDEAFRTDEAVEARLAATLEPGPLEAFAVMFPPPRQRWVRDLALSTDELARIRAPALLVHGAEDRVVPLESSTLRLLHLLPDVRAHLFGACGHASPAERPAELHRLLTTFLEEP
ncbi:alpha/beta fold hydrolase [Streptomyces sp. SBT349]|uniref:alpha/beta fold hydrolase n=1 Tax=Streptomyces sp. SBT349 TaxID=1580539 RepID=UPI000ABF0389|nr:alpha/beta fold hydrolase [Streptomyces sp. SBT349]